MAAKLKQVPLGKGGKTGRDASTLLEDGKSLEELFAEVDADGGGTIGKDELRRLMIKLGRQVGSAELDRIMSFIDEDNSGEIELSEFREWWAKETGTAVEEPPAQPEQPRSTRRHRQ